MAASADDPLAADQWGLAAIAAPDARNATTAQGVIVAIVDSGVPLDHSDLTLVLLPGIDLIDDDRILPVRALDACT